MSFLNKFKDFLKKRKTTAAIIELENRHQQRQVKINESFLTYYDQLMADGNSLPTKIQFPLQPYAPPLGVIPEKYANETLAMDDQLSSIYQNHHPVFFSGIGFPGFPFLTELTQISEYRDMSERTANEMTRKWITFRSISNSTDKSEQIKKIEAAFKRIKARDCFRQAAIFDGFMGGAKIFIDVGDTQGDELETPLMLNPYKIQLNSLRGLKMVELITTYPATYNSSQPLAGDYYVPSAWFVYGQKVHSSRMLNFVSRPLPDLLKPCYNFAGMSLSQLAQPYVDYWLNTRDSVGKLLRNFSTTVLKTDLSDLLQNGTGSQVLKRSQIFTKMRDNQGLFLLDNGHGGSNGEELTQLNVPLAGLDHLQAQAQEHMAAVAKTPLVILLGITPTGLNSSKEDEIRIYYDYIAELQENIFRGNLEILLKIVQLSEFGVVDEDITFDFVSLFAMTEKEKAIIRKSDSECATAYVTMGSVTPEEVRENLKLDPESGWNNLGMREDVPDVFKDILGQQKGGGSNFGTQGVSVR